MLARWLSSSRRRTEAPAFRWQISRAARRLMARLDAFAAFTDEPGRLTRLFLSPRPSRAPASFHRLVRRGGSSSAQIDAAGNVAPATRASAPGAPALMIGSHIDTVRDAGRYDGNFGALAALAVVEALAAARRAARSRNRNRRVRRRGRRPLSHDADRLARARRRLRAGRARPEGRGAASPCATRSKPSAAIPTRLADFARAKRRRLRRGAYRAGAGARGRRPAARRRHRHQRRDAARSRGDGVAGHAGATPMGLRRDALTAAAEMVLAIEARARREADLVATVGRLEVWPGATNVIPGHAQFSDRHSRAR